MREATDAVACAECGADVTSEKIKFQAEDGAMLCERCYGLPRGVAVSARGPARAVVVALRLAAYAVLVATVLSVIARLGGPGVEVLQVAFYGTLVFLLFIGVSEGLNILLALYRQSFENRRKLDRILESTERLRDIPSSRDGSRTP